MHSGGRGRSRLRLSERGLLQPPSPVKRRLFPRAQLLPFLLLALATLLAGYIIWSNWLRQTEDNLLRGPAPRVRPGGAGLGGHLFSLPGSGGAPGQLRSPPIGVTQALCQPEMRLRARVLRQNPGFSILKPNSLERFPFLLPEPRFSPPPRPQWGRGCTRWSQKTFPQCRIASGKILDAGRAEWRGRDYQRRVGTAFGMTFIVLTFRPLSSFADPAP